MTHDHEPLRFELIDGRPHWGLPEGFTEGCTAKIERLERMVEWLSDVCKRQADEIKALR